MQLSVSTQLLIAFGLVLGDIDRILPPYWYSVAGEGPGSLAYLFGLKGDVMSALLVEMGILLKVKRRFHFKKDELERAINLIDTKERPKGVQASVSKIKDPSQMHLRSKKATGRKHQWFIQIGSSSASRNWTRYDKASAQVKAGQQPPRTSIKLSIQLFLDATIVSNTIDDFFENETGGATSSEQDNLSDEDSVGNPEEMMDEEQAEADDEGTEEPMDEDPSIGELQAVNEPMNERQNETNTSTPAEASHSRPAAASVEEVGHSTSVVTPNDSAATLPFPSPGIKTPYLDALTLPEIRLTWKRSWASFMTVSGF